ncbi:MAG: hypothetical protein OEY38_17960, partial [Gammaproteobacteria bacterium]|nr:hypothetical protein [Gammaproteobacteria bacterium]
LYQWIAGNLSTLYYQTYQMAYDLAKKAEKAFQFERGLPESEVNFINGIYWDSQKKGLLAGERLGLSLDQMEKSYYDNDARRFEITKTISLLQLDPLAFLTLKNKGQCDFHFSEELFAYDFPSHYCRQIKTIALKIDAGDGVSVNATLTQLRNKIVMKPDAKAVKYLINPKDEQPTSIRNDWRASQQIAVSKIDDYTQNNNGMFEANMNDERYLAFEGTGAVSSWRLQLGGKRGSYNINELTDVSIELKYTALQGGSAFGDAVKGLLKPYSTSIYFDVAETFADAYEEFVNGNADELVINLYREMFPNLSGNKITGIYPRFVTDDGAGLTMVMNNDSALTLRSDKLLLTDSLSLSSQGETWRLKPKGDAASLLGIGLVLMYKANAS